MNKSPHINDLPDVKLPTGQQSMTVVVVILIGTGALLLISAIENQSLLQTFQGIISGKPITQSTTASQAPPGTVVTPAASGCPNGWTRKDSINGITVKGSYYCLPPNNTTRTCPSGYIGQFVGGLFTCMPASTTIGT